MKNIKIRREGAELGPYSLEEVSDLVSKGILKREDLALVAGSADWVPLKDLLWAIPTAKRAAPSATATQAVPADYAAHSAHTTRVVPTPRTAPIPRDMPGTPAVPAAYNVHSAPTTRVVPNARTAPVEPATPTTPAAQTARRPIPFASPRQEKTPPPKPLDRKEYMIGAALLVVLAAVLAWVVIEVKEAIEPFIGLVETGPSAPPSPAPGNQPLPTGKFFAVTMEMEGDSMSATLMTDDSHEAELCNQVMDQIYSLATKNPSANKLSLTVQVIGKKAVAIEIDDLDAVRNYQDKKAYENSEHRSFVGGRLVSAGFIQDFVPSTSNSPDAHSSLIGSYPESGRPAATPDLFSSLAS